VETRALLAFVISLVILIGYNTLLAPPAVHKEPADQASSVDLASTESPAPQAAEQQPNAVAPRATRGPAGVERIVTVETELYAADFTSFGGRLKSLRLKRYSRTAARDSEPLDMVESGGLLPLGLYWADADGTVDGDRDLNYDVTVDRASIKAGEAATVTMVATRTDGTRVTKRLDLQGSSYVLHLSATIAGTGSQAVGIGWARNVHPAGGRFAGTEGPAVFVDGKLDAMAAAALKEPKLLHGAVSWGGYADHYFLAAYFPDQPTELRFLAAAATGLGEAQLWDDRAQGHVEYGLFVGPKSIHLLGDLGHQLDGAVALGWFAVVARPLLELLFFLHRFTGNYGWAIIVLTVGIRIVFYPVNQKQAAAMKAMQRIQPEIKKLQERYKDDREQLNKEMMETYRRHKVNPLAGCLPMLIQIPVFIGLYNALMQAIELRHAPFIGWITDLSQPDRLGTWNIPFVSPPGIPVMTLLMGGSMILQQRMQPATGDPMQQKMMMLMPVVFTVMFINFPAGLVLYWLANNVMMIGQQYITNRSKS